MKNIIVFSTFAVFLLFTVLSSFETVSAQNNTKKSAIVEFYYTCSMHPEVHTTKPGDCPKCGMELIKREVVKSNSANKKTSKNDSTKMNHSNCCK